MKNTVNVEVLNQTICFNQPSYTRLTKLDAVDVISEETYAILRELCVNKEELDNLPITSFIDVVDALREAIFDDDCKILARCPHKHSQKVVYVAPKREPLNVGSVSVVEGDNEATLRIPTISDYFERLAACRSESLKILGVTEDTAKILSLFDNVAASLALSILNNLSPKDAMRVRKFGKDVISRVYENEVLEYKCDVCETNYEIPVHLSAEFWLPVVE